MGEKLEVAKRGSKMGQKWVDFGPKNGHFRTRNLAKIGPILMSKLVDFGAQKCVEL
mgnify:CR=1 FL=1